MMRSCHKCFALGLGIYVFQIDRVPVLALICLVAEFISPQKYTLSVL